MHTIKLTTPELEYMRKIIQGCKEHWFYGIAPYSELQLINSIWESLNDNNQQE